MWLSRKTSEISDPGGLGSQAGIVSVGGKKPAVVSDGETRSAEIVSPGGVVYIPRVGDEVLLERTCDDERVIIGKFTGAVPDGISEGEIYISTGSGGAIHMKNNGDIEISGTVRLTGRTEINGVLTVNGRPYVNGG